MPNSPGHSNDDFVLDRQRSSGDGVAGHGVGYLGFPKNAPGTCIQGDQSCVEGAEKDAIPEHRDTTVKGIDLIRIRHFLTPVIFPDDETAPGIDGIHSG